MIILCDPGHGANTAGKCSPDGKFREYRYARKVAAEVVKRLKSDGYDARLLVPEETDISLTERCNRVNKLCRQYGTKNVCLVSIHNNAAGSDGKWHEATGWEAWTSKGQTKSDKLADCLYAAAEKTLVPLFPNVPKNRLIRTDTTDGDKDKESNFTILYKSSCAACLTENFFQDTKADVEWLESLCGFDAIVRLHVDGIKDYVSKYSTR